MIALSVQLNLERTHHAYNSYRQGVDMFAGISIFLAVVSAVVVALLTYTGGVNCYDYYNRREKVDKSWSLPIKSRHRFWGDFAAGIVPVATAYIISSVVGFFIMSVGFPKQLLADNPLILPAVASGMFIGLLTLLSVFIVSVFCAALCGRVYETVVYPALICGIIPALIGLIGSMIFLNVWQIDITSQLFNVLTGTSPGGFFIGSLNQLFNAPFAPFVRAESIIKNLTFLKPGIIIPFILVNAAFLIGAFYLSKKRGAEGTGQSFVFRKALEILISLVVFCITAVFCFGIANDAALTPGLLFGLIMCTGIAFLILDVSAKRGFKKMGKAFFRYAIILTCSIVVSNVLLMTNGFGAGKYVPPLNRIQSAAIRVNFLDSMTIIGGYNVVQFKDREAVELIRLLNIESNENPYNYRNRRLLSVSVRESWQSVTYTLNNGNSIKRNLRLNEAQVERLLPLVVSDDYKAAHLDYIESWLAEKDNVEGHVLMTSLSQAYTSYGGADVNVFRLYGAFKADYLAETFEQRFNSDGKVLGILSLDFHEMELSPNGRTYQIASTRNLLVHVLPHYKNLIRELELQGFDVSGGMGEAVANSYPMDIAIIKADYIGANLHTSEINYDSWFYIDLRADARVAELLDALIDVAQPSHLVQGEGYLLYVVGGFKHARALYYVIPPAYNHLAQELHQIARQMSPEWEWGGIKDLHEHYMPEESGYVV
jgi:hypothetical protein